MTDETNTAEAVETTAPVESVEPVEQATPEVESEAPQTPDDAGEPTKPRGWVSARIKELADERNHWRDLALRYQQPAPEPTPKAPEPVVAPTLESVGYDEAKYQAAILEYAAKQAEAVVERRLSEVERQRAEQNRLESFVTRQKEFAKAAPDFEDKVLRDPTLPITAAMRDVIIDSPSGPEIAYYLAENKALAAQIASLPPHLAALEMGRIEGRLSATKAAPRPAVSKAPPPPPTVDSGNAPVEKSPEEMSADEWLKWREKQLRKRK